MLYCVVKILSDVIVCSIGQQSLRKGILIRRSSVELNKT